MRWPAIPERACFDQRVRPLPGPGDPVPAGQPLAIGLHLMRHGGALVSPVNWPEPFRPGHDRGQAAATSVLGFGTGAAPEIIDHSCTGYLWRNEEQMIAAVADVDQVAPRQCRAAAKGRFSGTPMAASYHRPCHAILERQLPPTCGTR